MTTETASAADRRAGGTAEDAEAAEGAGIVGPLDRGLAVLRALARQVGFDEGRPGAPPTVPTAGLVRATGLARSTVDRVLTTLAADGLVRLAGHQVAPAPGLAALGNAYLAACRLPDLLTGMVEQLADRFDEPVSIAVPDRDGARFVVQLARRRAMSPVFRVGDLLPAERCAAGLLFAADWDRRTWSAWRDRTAADPDYSGFPALAHSPADIRTASDLPMLAAEAGARGYAVDDQLVEPGLIAVAVPVRDTTGAHGRPGAVLCAVSVVSHTSRHSAASLADLVLPELRAAARSMEDVLAQDAPAAGAGCHPRPASESANRDSARPPAWIIRETKAELGAGYLQSLARGLTVLTAFDARRRSPTLSELARATGLPRATVRRSLHTLVALGYVRQDAGPRTAVFRPLPRVLDLGFTCLARLDLAAIARPHLTRLVERVRESASLAVLAGDEIRYVARVPAVRIMSVDITVGTRLPAYATSMGRVLLAGLPEGERAAYLAGLRPRALTRHTVTDPGRLAAILRDVARDGYALVREELEDGLQSMAVGIRDGRGRVVAAVSLSMHAGRLTAAEAVERMLGPLQATAAAISRDLAVLTAYRPLTG